ncbi:MAG: prealbumin-like fold domain-containing protein [Ilumatobacteraceae bacterium]
MSNPYGLAVDAAGIVYVTGYFSSNVFRIRSAEQVGRNGEYRLSSAGLATPLDSTSLADGSFSFDGLLPGTYTVAVTPPSGYSLVTSLVEVTVGVGDESSAGGRSGAGQGG